MDALLNTEALRVGYPGRTLVESADLQVKVGELVALLGVNGIGKSTLLRTLCGLQDPLSGRVRIAGEDLFTLSARERARRVSVVLTGRPATGSLDVATIVHLGRQPWTSPWKAFTPTDEAAVRSALKRVNGEHLMSRSLSTCSDGECQKVLIARALAQNTPVILLDEPTAFLDLPNRAEIVRMLGAIAREDGKAVLFSTHDLQLAMDLCDRVILLQAGVAPWSGTPGEALANGLLQQVFAGTGIRFNAEEGTHRFQR